MHVWRPRYTDIAVIFNGVKLELTKYTINKKKCNFFYFIQFNRTSTKSRGGGAADRGQINKLSYEVDLEDNSILFFRQFFRMHFRLIRAPKILAQLLHGTEVSCHAS